MNLDILNKMKKITLALLIIFTTVSLHSQKINIEVNIGLSGLSYNNSKATSSLGFGGSIGGNYTYPINKKWNIISGLHLGMHTTKVSLKNGTYTSLEIDDTNTAFEFRVNASNYIEEHNLYTLNIPLLAEYSTHINRFSKFYIRGGVKAFFPVAQNMNSKANQLELSGYYADTNIIVDDLPQHGFGRISKLDSNNTPFKTTIALSLQSGMDFNISKQKYYIGLYFDYGLNDISSSEKENSFIAYNSKGITKTYSKGIASTTNTENVKLISYGVALQFFIN